MKWPKIWKDRTWSQLQLTWVHRRSGQQVSHPDPCAPPAQQIDQKGLSSLETTALSEPSWWMSLGTLPPRVTAGPSLCPGLNLMYVPRVFWTMLHINTHKPYSLPNVVLLFLHSVLFTKSQCVNPNKCVAAIFSLVKHLWLKFPLNVLFIVNLHTVFLFTAFVRALHFLVYNWQQLSISGKELGIKPDEERKMDSALLH